MDLPENIGNLGISEQERATHIGWDIGALDVSTHLSTTLNAPLIATKFSRLVIDCNRSPYSPGSIPKQVHGKPIPGNENLTDHEVAQRVEEIFNPYHLCIRKTLQEHLRIKPSMVYFAIHSFTPHLNGQLRPWSIGITYERPSRFSEYIIHELRKTCRFPIGENEPYPITPEGDYGMYAHGQEDGVEAVLMEIRQDFLSNEQNKLDIAHTLHDILSRYH